MELTPLPFSNIGVSSTEPKNQKGVSDEETKEKKEETVITEDEPMETDKKDVSEITDEKAKEAKVIEADVVTDKSSKLLNSSPTKSNDLRSRKQSFDENVCVEGKVDKSFEVVKDRSNVLRSPNIMHGEDNRRRSNRGRKRKLSLDANLVKQKEDKINRKRKYTKKSPSDILSQSEPRLPSSVNNSDKRRRSKRARTKLDFSGSSSPDDSPQFFVEETEDSVINNETAAEENKNDIEYDKEDDIEIIEDTLDKEISEKILESKKLIDECKDELKEDPLKLDKTQNSMDEVPFTPKSLKCTKFPLVAPDPINSPSLKVKTMHEKGKDKEFEKDGTEDSTIINSLKANKTDSLSKTLPVISGRQKPLTESPIKARTQSNELKRLVFSSPVLKKFERTKQINSSPTSISDINIAITSKVSPGILKRKPSVSVEPSPKVKILLKSLINI